MKRIYWLLIAAVPVVLWWMSQSGSQEAQPVPAKPEGDKPPAAPEPTPEASKDLPTSSNGTFPKAAAPTEPPPATEAPATAETPAPVEEAPAPVPPAAPPEQIQEVAETAPPAAPQIEAPAAAAPVEGEPIQLFDSKDRPLSCQLLDITGAQAVVRCPESLPEKEKVRLVLPYNDEAITVNCQLLAVEDGASRFKIMTMKAGQKKRFEEYLSQRLGL